MKKIIGLCLCAVTFFMLHSDSFAMDIRSTYADVPSTGSTVVNLIDYANSYDSFLDSDYVVFRDDQFSHYIVWGDLETDESGRVVSVDDSDVEFIRYYRTTNIGNDNNYRYLYGVDDSFSLSSEHVNTSNLKNYGFSSSTYSSYYSDYQITMFLILIGSFLFAMMFLNLRRSL